MGRRLALRGRRLPCGASGAGRVPSRSEQHCCFASSLCPAVPQRWSHGKTGHRGWMSILSDSGLHSPGPSMVSISSCSVFRLHQCRGNGTSVPHLPHCSHPNSHNTHWELLGMTFYTRLVPSVGGRTSLCSIREAVNPGPSACHHPHHHTRHHPPPLAIRTPLFVVTTKGTKAHRALAGAMTIIARE